MKNIYILFTVLSWLFADQVQASAASPHDAPNAGRTAAAPAFTFTKTDVTTCNGASTGNISVTASGGAGNYVYSRDNGASFQAGSTFANLAAGTYQVVVKDGSNVQSAAQSVTISQPVAVTFSTTKTDVACNGDNTGSITVTASGGAGPYQYSKDNGASFQASNQFTTLFAGSYPVMVKNASGCVSAAQTVVITQPAELDFSTAVTNVSCFGGTNGSITFSASGGTGAYQYSINNGQSFQTGNTFSGLPASAYLIVLKDASGCLAEGPTVILTQPTALSVTFAQTNASCFGGATGSITGTASGGTGSYQYSKDNGTSFQASNTFTGLTAGTYPVLVKDANNCLTAPQSVTITQPAAVTFSTTKTDVACNGDNTGSITVTASGGAGPYQYSKDNGASFQASNQFTVLFAGSYRVVVKDASGCVSAAQTVVITQPTELDFSTAVTNVSCFGGTNGSITFSASGGTGAYQYSINNGQSFQAGNTFSGLPASAYLILLKDASGCLAEGPTVILTQPTALSLTLAQTNVSCFGGATGSITVSGSGGTAPYQYSKDNGTSYQTSNTFSGLSAGTYPVLVKDANNCLSPAQSIPISQPAALSLTASQTNVTTCAGGTNGSITGTASGGTAPYQYSKDNGTSFQASNTFTGLSARTYAVRLKDANNCLTAPQSVTITQPAAVAFTTTKTDVACNGDNTGSITVTASGGAGPYQYSKDNGTSYQSSNQFTTLFAGSYPVVVKNAGGCVSAAQTVVITQPAELDFSTAVTNVSCFGGTNGSITFSASGGTGAYQYSINNGQSFQTGNTFSGLPASAYLILVKDASGCLAEGPTVILTQPTALSVSLAQTNASCFGGATGSITGTASGGTAPYQYSRDNGTSFQASNTFTGLSAGTYPVLVKDANNCPSPAQSIPISQPAALSLTASQTNVTTCAGGTNGSITGTASGGTAPYQYSKDNGTSFQASNTFTGLSAGTYPVLVKDANNCLTPSQSVTISQPGAVTFSTTKTDVACNGDNSGAIIVTTSGGAGAYQYSKDNGVSFQTSNQFTALAAGSYRVVVKDAGGCVSAAQTVIITQPAELDFSTAVTNVSCFGGTNGSITFSASGGAGAYQYSINNGQSFQTGNTFSGLPASAYLILLKDANGCLAEGPTVILTQPTALSVTLAQTNANCFGGATGSITGTASGGTAPYQYSKDNGTSYQTSNTFTGLTAGTYAIRLKDANNCLTPSQSVTITQPAAIAFTTTKTDVACNGDNTGSITVTASGGAGPYQYSKDNGTSFQTSNSFTALFAGSYPVMVRNASGCVSAAQTVVITQPAELDFSTAVTNVSCFGGTNGSITFSASGGTGAYQYSINNGQSFQTGNTFSGLSASAYLTLIKDASGCLAEGPTVILTQPTALSVTLAQTNANCFGGATGSITGTASGGTAPYQYSKDNGTSYQTGNTFSGLTAGTYPVLVKDANNCLSPAQSIPISQPAALSLTASQTNVTTCAGGTTGSISLTATGGTGEYQYSINNGQSFQTGNSFPGLGADTYPVLVTDGSGCTSPGQTLTLNQPTAVSFTSTKTDVASCNGTTTGNITLTGSGGVAPYQYSRDNGASFQTSNSFTGLGAGSYAVVVKDANGCASGVQTVVINQPLALAGGVVSVSQTCPGQSTGSLSVSAGGGTGPYQYALNGGVYQSGTLFTGLGVGSYTLSIKDANGCINSSGTPYQITAPTPPTVTPTVTSQVSCFGGNDGSINVDLSGGTNSGQVLVSVDNGRTFNNSLIVNSLTAGVYPVVVKYATGCLTPAQSVTVTQPATAPAVTVVAVSPYYCEAAPGSFTLAASGGTGPYQYIAQGGSAPQTQDAPVFTGQLPFTYSVTVKDTKGCVSPAKPVDVQAPRPPSISLTPSNVLCNGQSTGSITVTAQYGTAPYQYSKDNGASFQTGNQFTGLAAGMYTILVKDAIACPVSQTITVGQPEILTMQAGGLPTTCFGGSTGSISVTASGGTSPYQYSTSNGASYQTASQFTGLRAGTYLVIVKDANNCVTPAQSITVTQPTVLTVTNSKTDVTTCFGGTNGSLSLTALGGTAPYQYSNDNGTTYQVANTFAGLGAGVYQLVVKDAGTCTTVAQSVTITQPQPITLQLTKTDVTTCYGTSTGSIAVTALGGTVPYQYSKDNGVSFQAANQFTALVAGVYPVLVKDANGCVSTAQSVTISQPAAISVSLTKTDARCVGDNTGSITVTATGGTGPYQYSNQTGNGFQAGSQFVNLAAGIYQVVVKDTKGCVTPAQSATINQPEQLTFSASQTNVTCYGTSTGSISFSANGGTSAYQYSIDNGNRFQTGVQFANLPAGSYPVLVKDANGCLSEALTVVLSQPAVLAVMATRTDIVSCSAGSTGTISLSATGGTTPYLYSLDNGGSYQGSPQFADLSAGPYQLVVKDANGCQTPVSVTIASPCCLSVTASPTTITNGQSATLTASGCSGVVSWNGGPATSGVYVVSPTQTTAYTATCSIATSGSPLTCTSVVTVTVNQLPVCALTTSASPTTLTNGQSSTLTASGCSGVVSWNGGPANSGVYVVNPTQTTAYTATCTIATSGSPITCTSVVTVTVIQLPVCALTTSASPATITNGQSATLTASGCSGVVSWNGGPANSGVYVVSPTQTTAYTATCSIATSGSPITCTSVVTVTVIQPVCALTTSASPNTITNGQSATLTASGCSGIVSWNGGPQSTVYVVSPTQTTAYTATCTIATSGSPVTCTSVVTVTVNQPTCTLTTSASPTTLTNGQSATLTASGCSGIVSWSGGPQNTVYVVSPTQTTAYTATCSIATSGSPITCTSVVTVTVNQPVCALTTSASPTTLTNGQSATLTASGCSGVVSWNGGPANSGVYVVSPTQTTAYTATCTIATSGSPVTCTSVVTVTVNQLPVCALTTSASPTTITNGQSSTLTASGCSGVVSWNGGPANSGVYVVNPTQTTAYTATCTIATSGSPITCTSVVTVTVIQLPVCALTTSASPTTITNGQSATLTASGCSGVVSWNGGPANSGVYVVNPTQTTAYTATCTIATSGSPVTCTSVVTVTVIQLPVCTITAQASSSVVFSGQSTTLTATGCANGTISWSGSPQTGPTLLVNPTATTTYVVTCTIPTSGSPVICTAPVTVTVVARPDCNLQVQSNPATVFSGNPASLTATGCNGTIRWSSGQLESVITVNPTVTTTYDATCILVTPAGSVSCLATATVTVIDRPVCTLSVQASPAAIFNGQSATLTAAGCAGGTVAWSSQQGGTRIIVNPTLTTTYSATCTFTTLAGSVTCTAPVTVSVTQPILQITGSGDVLPLNAITWSGTVTQNVGQFVWQYKTPAGDWQNFPATFDNNPSILVSATSILGSAAPAFVNQAIQLRVFSPYLISNVLTVTISQPAPLLTSVVTTKARCVGTATGSFTLTAGRNLEPGESAFLARVFAITNGSEVPVASYTFTGTPFASPNIFGKGTYRVRLQSIIGSGSSAESVQDFTIEDSPVLTLTATKTDILCVGGKNGTINLVAGGGVGPYQFAVNGGAFQPFQAANEQQITNLAAGTYAIQLRDNNACLADQPVSVTIAQPTTSLTITSGTVRNPTGFQSNDGTVTLQVTGGTPDYRFAWSVPNPATSTQPGGQGVTHTITNLGDGSYTVVVTDKAGCTTQASYSLTQPSSILAKTTIIKAISCARGADGIVQIDASGGFPKPDGDAYTYDWKVKGASVSVSKTNRLTNAASMTYTVTITDGNGVAKAFDVYMPEPLPVVVSVASLTNVACFGTATGGAILSVQGGVAPYVTRWNTQQTGISLINASAGRYVAVVIDANACQAQASVQIQQPLALSATLASVSPGCYDVCDGRIATTLTGGTAPYAVTWQNQGSQALSLTGLCSGSYTVNISDANGCTITKTTSLTRPVQKQIVLRTNAFICKSQTVDLDATIADGVSYVWTYPDGTTRTTPVVSVTSAGNYRVTATDKNGCTVTAQTSLSASDAQVPTLAFAVASQIGIGEPLIAINITPITTQTTWTIPSSASLISSTEDRLEVVFNSTGTYPITLNGVEGQCAVKATKMVTVVPASTVVNSAQTAPFIQVLTILPNPNSGTFKVRIKLVAVSDVKIRVKPLLSTGADLYQQSAAGQQEYELSVSIPPQNLQTGYYLLTLETAKAIQTVKLLITP